MTIDYRTTSVAAGWTISILLIALAAGLGSPASWIVLSVVALGPPLMLLHFARELPQTTAQRIRDARR